MRRQVYNRILKTGRNRFCCGKHLKSQAGKYKLFHVPMVCAQSIWKCFLLKNDSFLTLIYYKAASSAYLTSWVGSVHHAAQLPSRVQDNSHHSTCTHRGFLHKNTGQVKRICSRLISGTTRNSKSWCLHCSTYENTYEEETASQAVIQSRVGLDAAPGLQQLMGRAGSSALLPLTPF